MFNVLDDILNFAEIVLSFCDILLFKFKPLGKVFFYLFMVL